MLSTKKLIYKILNLPLVVEKGSNSNWTYRKWSDGTAECWRTLTSVASAPSGQVGGFYGRALTGFGFPQGLFVSAPIITVNCNTWGNGYHWATAYSITATSFSLALLRSDNASGELEVGCYAIGKWK